MNIPLPSLSLPGKVIFSNVELSDSFVSIVSSNISKYKIHPNTDSQGMDQTLSEWNTGEHSQSILLKLKCLQVPRRVLSSDSVVTALISDIFHLHSTFTTLHRILHFNTSGLEPFSSHSTNTKLGLDQENSHQPVLLQPQPDIPASNMRGERMQGPGLSSQHSIKSPVLGPK